MKHGTPVIPDPDGMGTPRESGRKAASGVGTRHPLEGKGIPKELGRVTRETGRFEPTATGAN